MRSTEQKPSLSERIAKARVKAGLDPDPAGASAPIRGTGTGFELAIAVLAFGFIGLMLDRWLNSKPWLMLLGLLLGLVAGLWSMHRASQSNEDNTPGNGHEG